MLIDAVLADPRCGWLGTERDKRAYFLTPLTSRQFNELEWYCRHRRGEHLYPAREWDLDAATMARTYRTARAPMGFARRVQHVVQ